MQKRFYCLIGLGLIVALLTCTGGLSRWSPEPVRAEVGEGEISASQLVPGKGLPPRLNVGIGTIIDHPALQAAITGFKEALIKAGYREGENLKVDLRNAQGVQVNVVTIAAGLSGSNADLFLAVGTDMARAIADREHRRPVLFVAVTDPVKDKIVASIERPGGNVTGTSDMNPVDAQFALIRELQPGAKRVGILYNPGETNSVTLVGKAEDVSRRLGISLVKATATNTAGVRTAASSMVGKVDAAYMPTDNTMAAAINVIIDVCHTAGIPFYSSESESVRMGGSLAALAVDYAALGATTGEMALQILGGKSPSTMPVALPRNFQLYLNETVASRLRIVIPAATKARAANIFH